MMLASMLRFTFIPFPLFIPIACANGTRLQNRVALFLLHLQIIADRGHPLDTTCHLRGMAQVAWVVDETTQLNCAIAGFHIDVRGVQRFVFDESGFDFRSNPRIIRVLARTLFVLSMSRAAHGSSQNNSGGHYPEQTIDRLHDRSPCCCGNSMRASNPSHYD